MAEGNDALSEMRTGIDTASDWRLGNETVTDEPGNDILLGGAGSFFHWKCGRIGAKVESMAWIGGTGIDTVGVYASGHPADHDGKPTIIAADARMSEDPNIGVTDILMGIENVIAGSSNLPCVMGNARSSPPMLVREPNADDRSLRGIAARQNDRTERCFWAGCGMGVLSRTGGRDRVSRRTVPRVAGSASNGFRTFIRQSSTRSRPLIANIEATKFNLTSESRFSTVPDRWDLCAFDDTGMVLPKKYGHLRRRSPAIY